MRDLNLFSAVIRIRVVAPMARRVCSSFVFADSSSTGSPSTALVFSVLRDRSSFSAMACTAVLSVRPSVSFRGSRMAPSMIRSSSSTLTSILRREAFFFMTDLVTP